MKVGLVGTGTMGYPMAERLLACGHQVTVWNRTREKALALKGVGADVAFEATQVAGNTDIVLSSLKDDAALRETLLDGGLVDAMPQGAVHCDTSTVSPQIVLEIAGQYLERGKAFVHAPVLGSKRQVAEGSLLIFASGPAAAIDTIQPVLDALGKRVWRFEEPDRAAWLKLGCNMLIASMICGFSQSLAFCEKSGVPGELFLEVVQESGLASPMFANKGRQILDGNWAANFFVDNLIKDLRLALEAGESADMGLPLLSMMQQMFEAASDRGYGREDYSAVSKVFRELAGQQARD